MKYPKILLALFFSLFVAQLQAQTTLKDYKTKTSDNAQERTSILDVVRNDLVKQKYPEFVFVVHHLKLKDNFAFFIGDATLKNGKNYQPKDDTADCCHVEYLLKKTGTQWIVVTGVPFSTDVWWACLWKEHKVPKEIFNIAAATCD
ncbi:MAG: hypothetical protein ACOVQA_12335 [Thermoflexibacteraceae bacterium]